MSLLEQLHRECSERLQALPQPGGAGNQPRKRGVLPPLPPDLTVSVAAFYTAWYLTAGALGFLGARAIEKVARLAGWKDATQKALGVVQETLQRMEPDLREMLLAFKEEKSPRTQALETWLEKINPALQELTERLRGQVSPEQALEVQGVVSEQLQRLHVPAPWAEEVGERFGQAVVDGLRAAPGEGAPSGPPSGAPEC